MEGRKLTAKKRRRWGGVEDNDDIIGGEGAQMDDLEGVKSGSWGK